MNDGICPTKSKTCSKIWQQIISSLILMTDTSEHSIFGPICTTRPLFAFWLLALDFIIMYSSQMIQIKSCLRYNLLFLVSIDVQICFFTDSSEIYLLFISSQLILKSKTDWHPISTLNHTIALICISLVLIRKYLLSISFFVWE